MSVNDITGDPIRTDVPSEKYRNNWDAIFGKKKGKPSERVEMFKATFGESRAFAYAREVVASQPCNFPAKVVEAAPDTSKWPVDLTDTSDKSNFYDSQVVLDLEIENQLGDCDD